MRRRRARRGRVTRSRRTSSSGCRRGSARTCAPSDDLRALPLTTRPTTRRALERDPPYGDLLGVPREQVARVHFSSGTTARPTPVAWTGRDLGRWADLYARMAWSQGVRPGDVHQCLFSYAWFVGGLGATAGYTRARSHRPSRGIGRHRAADRHDLPLRHDVDRRHAVVRAPHRRGGREPRRDRCSESRVRHVMVGGEPGGAVDGTRARIEDEVGRALLRRLRLPRVPADRLGVRGAGRRPPRRGLRPCRGPRPGDRRAGPRRGARRARADAPRQAGLPARTLVDRRHRRARHVAVRLRAHARAPARRRSRAAPTTCS